MPDPTKLVKAHLTQLMSQVGSDKKPVVSKDPNGKDLTVQFNPETLKVSFTNEIKKPEGNNTGGAALQFVGPGATKLAVQLVFDVTAQQADPPVADVRQLTAQVAFFLKPLPRTPGQKDDLPPLVRFAWGTFWFDGVMESMEESLEFFSGDGVPLRATVTFGMTQVPYPREDKPPAAPGQTSAPAGTQPLAQAPAGATVQSMAAGVGLGASWKAIAAANGIENPRQLTPGVLINLDVSLNVSAQGS
jgi:hypothetical protein